MRTDDLDFNLPPELIAQDPPAERTASRLLHYHRADRSIHHRTFAELPSLLRPSDLLVLNNTKVLPARFALRKASGGMIEGLFLEDIRPGQWRVLLRNLGRSASGKTLVFAHDEEVNATVLSEMGGGEYVIRINFARPA